MPSYWLARTLLLSFLSWILLIFTTIGMTLLPIACGRAFFYCAGIPSTVQHDPVSYIIGALICLTFLALGRSIASFLSDSRKVTGLMKSLLQMDRHSAFLSKSPHLYCNHHHDGLSNPFLLLNRHPHSRQNGGRE